jgi:GNAT superfamily N-acetyltransferase
MARIQVTPPAASAQATVLDLLARQMQEHDIEISEQALLAAIDGVFADDRRGFFLLALRDAEPAGVAYVSLTWSVEHGGKSAWLEELYVLPRWRDQGVGTTLLNSAIEEARLRGCASLDLEVESAHARAEHLYARHGFTQHSRARWVKHLRR